MRLAIILCITHKTAGVDKATPAAFLGILVNTLDPVVQVGLSATLNTGELVVDGHSHGADLAVRQLDQVATALQGSGA